LRKGQITKHREIPEWLEKMGGESALIEGFVRAEELNNLIEEQYHVLVEKYPDKWIAMPDSGEAIVAESTKELLAKLDELGIDRSDVARRFIRAPGRSHTDAVQPEAPVIYGFFKYDFRRRRLLFYEVSADW
jgi:hypothetical protein